ncbi:Eukaryotic initiation factor 4A [Parelaphostrongylus tenuis]|uniref:Eukaryotic initiation factor 4A n=1 Tax=Parelaphostrongylus tenuis TaxID=148309 RepID=A0AAD5QZL7_PARTN|nr:Eukaryotic initiation factor 4A [Parelaphostrongylus tenuis]
MTDANTRNKYVNNGGYAGSVAVDADGLIEGNYDQVVPSFDEMNLKENLLRAIRIWF